MNPAPYRSAWGNAASSHPTLPSPVARYRQQYLAATPPRLRPALVAPPASPTTAPALGSAATMKEGDLAAHLMRQMTPYSPLARAGQDRAWQGQVASQVQGIAAALSPTPSVTPSPGPIGLAPAAPAPRIGLASVPPAPPVPGAAAPVPGRDVPFVPSAIEPQKNTWRANQGSSTANWRLHAGMVPPPAESLPQARRPAATRVAGGGSPLQTGRAALATQLQSQLDEAQKSGDVRAVGAALAQMETFAKHGAAGLVNHQHEAAMAEAQREQIGAKIGVLDRSQGGRIGLGPEQAYQSTFAKTGDPQAAGQAYQWARITQNAAAAQASGQPVQVDPNDAGLILDRKYPAVAHLFQTDASGAATAGDLADLYASLRAIQPPGWNDPRSEFGQAANARIRQMYAADLPNQLYIPPSPTTWGLGGPVAGILANAAQGNFTLSPATDYARRKAAVDWFNSLGQLPAPAR